MSNKRRTSRTKRRALAAGVMAALATTVPVGTASADTPARQLPVLPALPAGQKLPGPLNVGALPAFTPAPLTFVGPAVAIGPTVIGSVFNGGTAVVVSNYPVTNSGNVTGSP